MQTSILQTKRIFRQRKDIVSDLNYGIGIDEEGDYYNGWGVTDHYDSDSALSLSVNEDFAEED